MNENKLKIVHITSPGFRTAGKLVFDIHTELLKRGHESFVICKSEIEGIDRTYSYYNYIFDSFNRYKSLLSIKLSKLIPVKINKNVQYSFLDIKENRNQLRYCGIVKKIPFNPDVIILYALQDFINAKTIRKIFDKTEAKIFWLIYDAAPLTGGCHYPWDCRRYQEKCGKCPQLKSDRENDVTRRNWEFKKKCFAGTDIKILAGSEWTHKKTEESSLFKNKQVYRWLVPVINAKNYGSKDVIKSQLGLKKDIKYILFGATSATNERKGLKYLIEALNILNKSGMISNQTEIIIVGRDENLDVEQIPFRVNSIGFIQDRDTLLKYYKSAHVVIVPSIEDAGPLMISEALSQGTPVVSFEMGIAPDLIFNGISGYKAKLKNSADMAEGISGIINLNDTDYSALSVNCLKISRENLDMDKQIDKLVEIITNKV